MHRHAMLTRWLFDRDGGTTTAPVPAVTAAASPPERMHWRGTLTIEDEPTGDGRMFAAGALTWETPMPLTWQPDGGSHVGAYTVGTIWNVTREGNAIVGEGTFDLNAPPTDEFPEGIGLEAARQVSEGITPGVSVEIDTVEAELRVREEILAEQDAMIEALMGDDIPEPRQPDEDGRVVVDAMAHDDFLEVVTAGRVRTVAQVTTPAFDGAEIDLADGVTLDALRSGEFPSIATGEAVVAAAGPDLPPAGWFDNPQLDGPTHLTVTDDGRVFGHLATWDTCHIGRADRCLTPPRGSAYAHFRTGETRVACDCPAGWDAVATGVLTVDTGHARTTDSAQAAAAHYDHTGTGWADVAVGEDQYGIWVAGAVRPGVSDATLRTVRASDISGDWRRIGGRLELVAALSVNVGGFPVRNALAASGGIVGDVQVSLIAAGMLRSEDMFAGLTARLDRIERVVDRMRAATLRDQVRRR